MPEDKQGIALLKDTRVFLVDDHKYFQQFMKNMLQQFGIASFTAASTVEEAKRICSRHQFELYLVDYNLGSGENGRQFIHYLHRFNCLPPDSLVFMVTGDASRAMVLSAIEEEPDDYLIKPFSMQQFRQRLDRSLLRHNALRDVYQAQREHRHQDVIRLCHEGISKMSPYSMDLRLMLSEASIKTGDCLQAKSILEEGLSFRESAWYRLELGKVCFQLEDYEEALENLALAQDKKPFMMEIYRLRCAIYTKTGKYEEADRTISDAVTMSPQSSALLNMQFDLATAQRNYLKMRDCIASLMELHRFETDRLADLLSCYVHTAILFAIQSGERYHLDMLPKNIHSTTRRFVPLLAAGNTDFSQEIFESAVQARIDITTGNPFKGKKSIYKLLDSISDSVPSVPESIFSNITAGLEQLGDYEYAQSLLKQRSEKQKTDPMLQTTLELFTTDDSNKKRREKYHASNRSGIQAYKDGNYQLALQHFEEALHKSPTNTFAIINKAQSLLKLIQGDSGGSQKKENYITSCRSALNSLSGLPLNDEFQARVKDIEDNLAEQEALRYRKKK